MMLKTVDDVCDFAAEWCNEKGVYSGKKISTSYAVPHCIMRLNARIGNLWHSAKRPPGPLSRYSTPFHGLLGGQDEILNPDSYDDDKNGVVSFVRENQGVWSYGFDPNDLNLLLVTGDWHDGRQEDFKTEWRIVLAKPEDALVCTLLINLCLQSDAYWDENSAKPEAARSVLWQHPAWRQFDGFWINDAKTLIYFDGWLVSRR
jgi:hypothetical protein